MIRADSSPFEQLSPVIGLGGMGPDRPTPEGVDFEEPQLRTRLLTTRRPGARPPLSIAQLSTLGLNLSDN